MSRNRTIIIISCIIIAALLISYLVISMTMNNSATLYVDPQTTEKAIGQDFSVNISISNVADLYGWQLQLGWNKTILDVVNVTEGAFLKNYGQTSFTQRINDTGSLLSFCTRLGDVNGVNGSGVLATVQFHVIGKGQCDLHLYETILVSSSDESITHTVKSGTFST